MATSDVQCIVQLARHLADAGVHFQHLRVGLGHFGDRRRRHFRLGCGGSQTVKQCLQFVGITIVAKRLDGNRRGFQSGGARHAFKQCFQLS